MSIGGKNTTWKHGTQAVPGTLTDYSANMRSVSPNYDRETVDATTFGDSYKDHEMSFKNAAFETVYKYSEALYAELRSVYHNDTSVIFEYSPNGTTSTYPKDTGTMFITKIDTAAQIGNLLEINVSWQVSGAVTPGAHS